ncbi:MAG: energy transducer TonB [Candidatus Goldiibacteriota bacterium]|jgi:TonB family protein
MKKIKGNLVTGTTLSFIVHLAIAGFLYLWAFGHLHLNGNYELMQLDMSAEQQANVARIKPTPVDNWIISDSRIQPPPKPVQASTPVPTPVPTEVWVPAASTARRPKWIANFISPDDYPAVARQEGNDGRVILRVRIDSSGKINEVILLQGGCQILNEVAIRKVKNGIFTPAYNAQGLPIPCEVILPIKFQLKG